MLDNKPVSFNHNSSISNFDKIDDSIARTNMSLNRAASMRVRIGLEIHAQLMSQSKLFSRSPTRDAESIVNSNVSLFDAAIPGTLPVLNKFAVNQAVKAALAMNCKVNPVSLFERKHYFYQDLPLGYQITQQRFPIAESGKLSFNYARSYSSAQKDYERASVGIQRIQIEQDSGKTLHDAHDDFSLIDLNRAGMGLIEIVFLPDLSTPEQAAGLVNTVKELLRQVDICNGNLEDGSLRCDVNLSVEDSSNSGRKSGNGGGSIPRVEIKNLNSIQRLIDASNYEINRQIETILEGGTVIQETRGFDPIKGKSFVMRTKETAMDYRYFPDPDLPALHITDEEVAVIAMTIPELPSAIEDRLLELGLSGDKIGVLMSTQSVPYFESVLKKLEASPGLAKVKEAIAINDFRSLLVEATYTWTSIELLGRLNTSNIPFASSPVQDWQCAAVVESVLNKSITVLNGKEVLMHLFNLGLKNTFKDPKELISELGFSVVNDSEFIRNLCVGSIKDAANTKQWKALVGGNKGMFNFFVGDVVRRSGKKADPQTVRAVLQQVIDDNIS